MDTKDIGINGLKTLPDRKRLDLLVRQEEDQWLDRKSARATAQQIANTMIGFANAEGGMIVIGIHDGMIEGISASPRKNDWRQAALDYSLPPVRHKIDFVECTNYLGAADKLAIIEVEASEHVHANQKDETYLRVGDETRKLNHQEAQELIYDKGESTYDGSPVKEASIKDLNETLVKSYLKSVGANGEQKITALKARGLVKDSNDIPRPTVAGILLMGNNPQIFMPHAYTRILCYKGSSRETGTRLNVTYDKRIEGTLGNQIAQAQKSLRKLLPEVTRLDAEGRFRSVTLVPEYVWLEAIVNAIIHRSYSFGGDHIRIELFDDRIEVRSPGRLPGLVRLDNIRSTRFARNPRIARALNDLRYGRELGEGVNRMFEEMHTVGLPDPIYAQSSSTVQVVLLEDPLAGRILRHLPVGSERFVEFISRENRVTTNEAASLLGVSLPTARRHLRNLQEKGLIVHVGTSSMDPRGYWKMRT